MIRRNDDRKIDLRESVRGGVGRTIQENVLCGEGELNGKGRLYAHMKLEPGCSIGFHEHIGDTEAYYILKGNAEYDDNGVTTTLQKGDVTFTDDGEGHAIKNVGDSTLEFMALILYK
ncbi:MAG: cupin domain-containing protein [Oscillospiraceae bacterium]